MHHKRSLTWDSSPVSSTMESGESYSASIGRVVASIQSGHISSSLMSISGTSSTSDIMGRPGKPRSLGRTLAAFESERRDIWQHVRTDDVSVLASWCTMSRCISSWCTMSCTTSAYFFCLLGEAIQLNSFELFFFCFFLVLVTSLQLNRLNLYFIGRRVYVRLMFNTVLLIRRNIDENQQALKPRKE